MLKLSASDILLLGLATIGDLAEEVFIGGSQAYKHAKLISYFPPGYKKINLVQNVYRQIKKKNIIAKNNSLLLTKAGEDQLRNRFPLAKLQQQSWNQKWCLVSFDIPEQQRHQRNQLRNKLEHIGFAQLQKSIYISPHPFSNEVIDFIKQINMNQYCFVLEGKQKHLEINQEKIYKLWKIQNISNAYNKLLINAKKQNKNLISGYLEITIQDPHLPFELLPSNWPAKKVKKMVSNLITQVDDRHLL